MRIVLTILLFLFQVIDSQGQSNYNDSTLIETSQITHNIICLVPSKADFNNGWSIGWSSSLDYNENRQPITINGIYTNLSPIQPIIASVAITMIPFALLKKETYQKRRVKDSPIDTVYTKHKLNGLAVGLFEIAEDFTIQGVQITALYQHARKLNGLSVTPIASDYSQFNGIMISGLYNKTHLGKGLQIGVINKAHKMYGVQIGLWNIIGNKGFPIINMRFRKNKTQSKP